MEQRVCGSNRIAGCNFAIYPMTDDFVQVIQSALKEVDTSKVWMETTDIGTCVRGRITHIFDVTKAAFLQAASTGHHVVFNATYSIGCPGDTSGDTYMAEDESPLNAANSQTIHQEAAGMFSLYPMGGGDYMDTIYSQIESMKQQGIEVSSVHYATRLDGDGNSIYNGLEQVFTDVEKNGSSHTVMTVTISANSPSTKGGKKE
ncbi:YkoF family thiamine/hydroxymethylpyrimidine-binding protein [Pontibacillus salicampi]|uniref:YkoF family thiamine/hydroxymethylpyrimidine-binding protein n=1 Tax=Pontibacillus salicampi TaxID=1449801 RepID=A0ABV6LRL7_9BACI